MADATTTKPDKHVVRIWDDPESRINFMETILKNKEWEAVIYHPDFAPDGKQRQGTATPLPELNQKLQARGYKTSLAEDENGIPTLSVRNFGSDTSLAHSVKEMGFAKGMTHKLTHIGEPLGDALSKTASMVKHVASDKARLIGGLYLIGDVFLIFAGLGNKKGEDKNTPSAGFGGALKDPANMLQSVAGVAATLQSFIYMGFAKEGSEAMYSELMNRSKDAADQGKDLLDPSIWQDKEEKGTAKGILGLPEKVLKRYPIQLGALTQVGGQLALMASGGIRVKRGSQDLSPDGKAMKRGAIQDMITATSSIVGWSLLTKTKSEKIDEADKKPWSDPGRVWQEMSANPNQFASGFLSAATLSGIAAGHAKSNKIQTMGNLTYLFGDGIMFATKSDDYGAAGMSDSAMLADAAEQFVKASPIVLGEKEQSQFVQQLSHHLAERSLYEDAKKSKAEVTDEQVQDLGGRIAADLTAKLPNVNERTNEAAARIARVVEVFNPHFSDKITDSLCAALCEMDGVSIDTAELKQHVTRHTQHSKTPSTKMVKMDDVAQPLSDLLFATPGAANPDGVNKLYDAIDEHIRPEPLQTQGRLEETINKTAMRDIAAASQQQVQTQSQPPVGSHTAALLSRQQSGQGTSLLP